MLRALFAAAVFCAAPASLKAAEVINVEDALSPAQQRIVGLWGMTSERSGGAFQMTTVLAIGTDTMSRTDYTWMMEAGPDAELGGDDRQALRRFVVQGYGPLPYRITAENGKDITLAIKQPDGAESELVLYDVTADTIATLDQVPFSAAPLPDDVANERYAYKRMRDWRPGMTNWTGEKEAWED